MKTGPIPKPKNLKLVQGTFKKQEEKPCTKSLPDCPPHLSELAKKEWERILPIIERWNLVSELDTASLALYCVSYARWQEAETMLARIAAETGDSLVIMSPSKFPVQNPYLSIANRAMEDCYKYLQQFGLSPAARTRVTAEITQGDLFGQEKQTTQSYLT